MEIGSSQPSVWDAAWLAVLRDRSTFTRNVDFSAQGGWILVVGQTGMRVSVQLSNNELSRITASRVNECIIADALIDNPISARSLILVCPKGLHHRSRNEGTIVPSFHPFFDFRSALGNFFALRSWRLLPLRGRGKARKARIMPQDGRGLRGFLREIGSKWG